MSREDVVIKTVNNSLVSFDRVAPVEPISTLWHKLLHGGYPILKAGFPGRVYEGREEWVFSSTFLLFSSKGHVVINSVQVEDSKRLPLGIVLECGVLECGVLPYRYRLADRQAHATM